MNHTPTEEQQAIIEAVGGRDSVMVEAGAGCAKSSTQEMAAPQIKVPALGLAFNRNIAGEMKTRMPGNFDIKTFNGLGFGAALRALPPSCPKATVEEKKLGKLVSSLARSRDLDLSGEQWDGLRRLVSGVMQAGITPGDRGRPLVPDTRERWAEVAEDLMILPEDFEYLYDTAREVLVESIKLTETRGIFSFDDQVYFSTCIAGQFAQYPVVFGDEVQDLNPLNHRMLELSVRPDGKLFLVGDPKQSLYGFRGAVTDGMARLRALRPAWADRSLLTTFRCPKAVVARQQTHVPGYRAWHTNADGVVTRLRAGEHFELGGGWDWVTIERLKPAPTARVMVLCRNNGPLLSLAFKLIRGQVGVTMLGRDIGKGLVVLSRKLLPTDTIPLDQCIGKVRDWMESETSLAVVNGHEEKVEGITDRGECLLAVLGSGCRDSGELRLMLDRLFSKEHGQVELGSIHRAKGMERDVILHLDPWRIPSRWAKKAAERGDMEPLKQEWNARYVAETRTKHTLIEANLEDFTG